MKPVLFTLLALFSPLALAATVSTRGLIWMFLQMLGIAAIFGILAFLVRRAPFIEEPWKSWITYFLVVVGCIIIIFYIIDLLGL